MSCHQPAYNPPPTGTAPTPPRRPGSNPGPSSTPAAASPSGSDRNRPAGGCRGTKSHTGRSPRPHRPSDQPGPAADTPASAPPPDRSACGSHTASRPAQRSPSPASSEPLSAAPGSAARTHRPVTPPASAHTWADHRWPTPPSPCSANSRSPGRSPISRTPSERRRSCPQEVPRARQLRQAAEWYVGIVMMIIGQRGDGEDEKRQPTLLRREERQQPPRRLRTASATWPDDAAPCRMSRCAAFAYAESSAVRGRRGSGSEVS